MENASRGHIARRHLLGLAGGTGMGMVLSNAAGGQESPHANHGSSSGPAASFPLHFCGIHVAKNNKGFQIITQHYCGHRGDVHQCLLFESSAPDARLLGVEYIIPDAIYRTLPDTERVFWHPHTYEVLAGGLIAPEMPEAEEREFMKALLTTWGKTWHTWPDPTTNVPLGEPLLMWALTGDGQIDPKVLEQRDREFQVNAAEIRKRREQEIGYQAPQVSFPQSVNQVGRQWTDSGGDTPAHRK